MCWLISFEIIVRLKVSIRSGFLRESMKVTVCELAGNQTQFQKDWQELRHHLDDNKTDLLLLRLSKYRLKA